MSADFASLSLSPALLAVIKELGYQTPTPIQTACIPNLLAGKDLIGQSKTGSGKTAAFALPILQRIGIDKRSLQALVVCPTRELSAQVAREFRKLGRRHPGLVVLEVTGGQRGKPQKDALERGVHVAVGTPGRLLDHLQRRTLDARQVQAVVLDEADRMLDMGFGADVEKILHALPKSRQTMFFSATFPASIKEMSQKYQRSAVRVTIDDPDDNAGDIVQLAVVAEADRKLGALYWLLEKYPHESALIFCNFKATVAALKRSLVAAKISVDSLHGDLEQFDRDKVLAKFRNQSVRVLIATDVAGRGIDLDDLDLVINYELPAEPSIYVHRIGRTGRAGKKGIAITLATDREQRKLKSFEQRAGAAIERLQYDASARGNAKPAKSLARDALMHTILISGGRKDKVRPGDILGALTGESGDLKGTDVGKIEIHDRLSYVAVARNVSQSAVKSLNSGRIKGKRFRATLV